MLLDTTLGPRVELETDLEPEECTTQLRARVTPYERLFVWAPPAAGADFVAGSVRARGAWLFRVQTRPGSLTYGITSSRPIGTVTLSEGRTGTRVALSVGLPLLHLLMLLLPVVAVGVCVGLPVWVACLLLVLDDPSRVGPWLLLASLTLVFGGLAAALGFVAVRVPEDLVLFRAFLERALDARAVAPGDAA